MSTTIEHNLRIVREKIRHAAAKRGKTGADITLVAVTKTFPPEIISKAIALGVQNIGENRVQEARQKFPEIREKVTRHMIGHLQKNKVKYAVRLFDMIQSVDSVSLAEEINARVATANLGKMPVLIQVNTSNEPQKSGCQIGEALVLLKAIDRLPNLIARGFMTVALFSDDPEKVRPCFKVLKKIYNSAETLTLERGKIDTLSMGMSADFEVAIEEGANMVRIGSAIFGERNSPVKYA